MNDGDIRRLCAAWRAEATRDGGIAIGPQTERFRLRHSGIQFHELSFKHLREAVVGVTENLLLPGMNTVVDLDHMLVWSWSAEILIGGEGPLSRRADPEISDLAATAVRAALANTRGPTREAHDAALAAFEAMEHNAREFVSSAHIALPYLAFPLLEAVSRRACCSFVDLRGHVLQAFSRRNGDTYPPGSRCNSIGDLLALLVGVVADASLAADLKELLDHVATFGAASSSSSASDAYGVLSDWRNSSLHGESTHRTIGGTVLSIALLVALHGIGHDYESRQTEAVARAKRELLHAGTTGVWGPAPWSYYPPFL